MITIVFIYSGAHQPKYKVLEVSIPDNAANDTLWHCSGCDEKSAAVRIERGNTLKSENYGEESQNIFTEAFDGHLNSGSFIIQRPPLD